MTTISAPRSIIVALSFLLFGTSTLHASEIKKVKGEGVLIQFDAEGSAQPGDSFYALNAENKKKAIIEVTKVKGTMGVGKIRKGQAEVGMTLEPRTGDSSRNDRIKVTREKKKAGKGGPFAIGGMLGLGYDTMSLTATPPGAAQIAYTLTGTGYSADAVGDYALSKSLYIRAFAGLENFSVSGTSSRNACGNFSSTNCSTQILFIRADGELQFKFDLGPGKALVGGGGGIWMPMSSSTNALDSSTITTMAVFHISAGYDFKMNDTMYFPVELFYHFFPSSSTVQTSLIALRFGALFNF